jgi:hypothetical protein
MSSFVNSVYNWVSNTLYGQAESVEVPKPDTPPVETESAETIPTKTICGPSDLYVFTDLEPDDYLALWILNKNGYKFKTVVVGEGKFVQQKAERAYYYFNNDDFYPESCPYITVGESSDKDFPESFETDETYDNFSLENLKEFVQNGGTKILIMKPPRELFQYIITNPAELSFLKNTKCYLYGSFNMKSLDATDSEFRMFCDLFDSLYVYESFFATGPQNNLNPQNFPLIQKLRQHQNFSDLLDSWDDYILKDCEDTCIGLLENYNLPLQLVETETLRDVMSEKDFNRYGWNYKCYCQVKPNRGFQTVLADSGLAITLDVPQFYKRANVEFGTLRNTLVTFDENGKHFVCMSDFDTVVNRINTVFEE